MSHHCNECDAVASDSCYSYKSFGYLYDSTLCGHCVCCKDFFCDTHNIMNEFDDECGFITQSYFCYQCVRAHNELKEHNAEWWDEVPWVGWLVASYIRSSIVALPRKPKQD